VNVAGLILAAGESRRMGSPKALLDFRGETFLDHLIGVLLDFCSPVIAVLGSDAVRIREGLAQADRAILTVNQQFQLGQLSSMQAGLRALPTGIDRVVFTLVDHPNLDRTTLARLLREDAPLVIPRFQGRRGHPMIFAASLAAEFLSLPPESSAREVLRCHSADIVYVDVDDPGIRDDIDNPELYARLTHTGTPWT
jgi:molybdenum cofactor cytidylyltransferase